MSIARVSGIDFNTIVFQEREKRVQLYKDLKFFHLARECDSCLIDANSIARNTTSSIKAALAVPAVAIAVAGSALIGGLMGVPIGFAATRDACIKCSAAISHRDPESFAHHSLWGITGVSYGALSALMVPSAIGSLANVAIPAAVGVASSGLGLAMYGAMALHGAYGVKITDDFGKKWEKVTSERDEVGALQWLKEQISLCPEEIKACKSQEEIAQKLQRKWSAFDLRVGRQCGQMVRDQLPGLLADFKVEPAKKLIQEVEKANYKEKVKYALFILIALIGLASFIALLLTMGPAGPALLAIASFAWLAVDSSKIHSAIAEKCWEWHRGSKTAEIPCLIDSPLLS